MLKPVNLATDNSWGENEDKTVWQVKLSNGLNVFLDDERQGSAWLRLASFCRSTGNTIENMWLRFRSHTETIGPAAAYYFIKSSLGTPTDKRTYNHFIVGTLNGETIKCKSWLIPELTIQEEFDRSLDDRFYEQGGVRHDLLIPGVKDVPI